MTMNYARNSTNCWIGSAARLRIRLRFVLAMQRYRLRLMLRLAMLLWCVGIKCQAMAGRLLNRIAAGLRRLPGQAGTGAGDPLADLRSRLRSFSEPSEHDDYPGG